MKKRCTKCNRLLSLDQFYPSKCGRLGVMSRCRKCHIETVRAYQATSPRHKATVHDPEKQRQWHRAYRESHREALAAKQRRYYERHKDKIRARMREYMRGRRLSKTTRTASLQRQTA